MAGPAHPGSASAVFLAFLRLGLTSFGGPVAHLGYFRRELVERRRWLDEPAYADLVALCQFLPGPASSQVGFAIGLLRAGWRGGLAAWAGFTLPSAALLVLFATVTGPLPGNTGLLHGLELAAVAVVAQAVWGMGRSLCPDRERAAVAVAAAVAVLLAPLAFVPILAIVGGGLAGLRLPAEPATPPPPTTHPVPVSRRAGAACLLLAAALLVIPPLLPTRPDALAVFDAFYRAGALVFGGGHVVLPLLRDTVVTPGWIASDTFLAGYAATQAMPGPLFTVAAYLGARLPGAMGGLPGAALALAAIFLPGLLLLAGALPFWHGLRARASVQAALRGINAAVVGLLGAALYDPVWTAAIATPADLAVALVAFALLVGWHAPPLLVVAGAAAAGLTLGNHL